MNKTHAVKATRQIPIALHGTGNHLIGHFLLTIGTKPPEPQPGSEPLHFNRQTMADILRLWRRSRGPQLDRPSPHAAAVFDLAPTFLAPPEKATI